MNPDFPEKNNISELLKHDKNLDADGGILRGTSCIAKFHGVSDLASTIEYECVTMPFHVVAFKDSYNSQGMLCTLLTHYIKKIGIFPFSGMLG